MKCDILFLAHGRPEFTAASMEALAANTNWSRVDRMVIYTDGELWGHHHRISSYFPDGPPCNGLAVVVPLGGPVNIMNHYLAHGPASVFAKIDNDVIVPPGWLDAALDVMEHHSELAFLGLEPPASRTRSPYGGRLPEAPEHMSTYSNVHRIRMEGDRFVGYAPCDAIGGVGLMRSVAFLGWECMVQHSTYGGFTDWQLRHPSSPRHPNMVKGWIVPPLKLFLLDRLPIEPWASLSKKYEAAGQQRFWTRYPLDAAFQLWDWWL